MAVEDEKNELAIIVVTLTKKNKKITQIFFAARKSVKIFREGLNWNRVKQ